MYQGSLKNQKERDERKKAADEAALLTGMLSTMFDEDQDLYAKYTDRLPRYFTDEMLTEFLKQAEIKVPEMEDNL